jgi:hypothetical protein
MKTTHVVFLKSQTIIFILEVECKNPWLLILPKKMLA